MKILALILLGAVQGKLGPISVGSVNIHLTILPPKPTQEQIITANNGDTLGSPGAYYNIIRQGNNILVEPL